MCAARRPRLARWAVLAVGVMLARCGGDDAPGYFDVSPMWSPDGSQILFSRVTGDDWELCLYDVSARNVRPLIVTPHYDGNAWSPDGEQFVFSCDPDGRRGLWIANADGTNAARITNLETER